MKTFLGFVGAFLVGLCVGMTSMTFCPYLSKFVCQARQQCPADCCPAKDKCCSCEQDGKLCDCCVGCFQGKECTCEKCVCCPCCKGHVKNVPAVKKKPCCPPKN